MEIGTLMSSGTTMSKRERVFAVRNFPAGCGCHVPQINPERTSNDDVLRSIENRVDAIEKHDRKKAPIEVSGSSVPTENSEQENDLESKLENQTIVPNVLVDPAFVEEKQIGVKLLGVLLNGKIDEPKQELGNNTSGGSFAKTNHGDAASLKEIISKKSDTSAAIPLCDGLGIRRQTRNYPPRRKVSAIRRFPFGLAAYEMLT